MQAAPPSALRPSPSEPRFPSAIVWSVEIPAPPAGPPVVAGNLVVVATMTGQVLAKHTADGREAWSVPLAATAPLAADGDVVIVPGSGEIHALAVGTGESRWSLPVGTITAPPLLRGGWLVLAIGEDLMVLAAADGDEVWSSKVGLVEQTPAIDGTSLYVAVAEGRVLAADLQSGVVRWEALVPPNPTAPFPYGDRLYFGAGGIYFVCLKTSDGTQDWSWRIGAEIRGTASGDASRIYIASMDNLLRAFRRSTGNGDWKQDLGYRPLSGPMLIGSRLAVGGRTATMRVFTTSGGRAGELKLPDPAVVAPGLRRREDASDASAALAPGGPALAIVTGDPAKPYLLVFTGEPVPTLPEMTPLTVLPGEVLPPMTLPGA